MIYADTSALVKLVAVEDESPGLRAFVGSPETLLTSVIGAIELRRAIRRTHPERLSVAEGLLSRISIVGLTKDVMRLANMIEPESLRTLDAIHLASALTLREELDTLLAYDLRLIEAAQAAGLPVVSPR